jgi:hypothetical protein
LAITRKPLKCVLQGICTLALLTVVVAALGPLAYHPCIQGIEVAHAPASTSASHRQPGVVRAFGSYPSRARIRFYFDRVATNTQRPPLLPSLQSDPASRRIAHNDAARRLARPRGAYVERDGGRLQQSRHLDSGPVSTARRWNTALL